MTSAPRLKFESEKPISGQSVVYLAEISGLAFGKSRRCELLRPAADDLARIHHNRSVKQNIKSEDAGDARPSFASHACRERM